MRRIYSIICIMLLIQIGLMAQPKPQEQKKVGCKTSNVMEELYKARPQSKKEAQDHNKFAKSFQTKGTKATSYVIPIVFHVFGTSFNGLSVDDALIQDALQKTNEDFQGITADWNEIISEFDGVKMPIDISFKLAQLDPDGNPTTGITYHSTMSGFGNGSGYDSQIQDYAWDNYMYFNVYIQNDLYNNGTTNNSGVCWYPDTWMSNNDLARCVYNGAYIGNNTSENFRSVLTHEFGHYMNLIHTFEGGCPDASGCSSSGDECCDTPPAGSSSIGTANNCEGNVTNWQNFMNYSDQYAMYTIDQVTRMEAALQHAARVTLWQESNLVATGLSEDLGPRLVSTSNIYTETYQNNGSISTTATLTAIDGAEFAVTGNLSVGTHFTVSNVPSGLTVQISVSSSTSATIAIAGNANSHANANDVSNMSITFLNPAIVGGTSGLYSATLSNLTVNFIDPYQVVTENITDISVNSTDTWVYFTIQNGTDFGIWYDSGNLRLETYTRPLVCEGSTKNISLLPYEAQINSSSNWVDGGAYPDEHDLRTSSYTTWDGQTAYIGFQFESLGHPCYGWFKVTVASNGASYTLSEYAYNEEPYGSILAGTIDIGDDCVDPITAPSSLLSTGKTTTSVSLSWDASTGGASDCPALSNYNVYRNGSLAGSPSNTSFTDTELNPGTTYTYTVKAEDENGGETEASNSVNVTTVAVPTYDLTVNISGQGSVTPNGGTYNEGTVVSLSATADAGSEFSGWSGAISGSTNPANITMNSNKTVTATFTDLPNIAPTVSITSPANNAEFSEGNNITITATADDEDGNVSLVEFYNGTTKLGEDSSSPYSYTWNSAVVGDYVLTAIATDNESASTTSTEINISVTDVPYEPCASVGKSQSYEYITGVTIGSFTNSSGNNSGYSDNSYQIINLTAGSTAAVSLVTNNTSDNEHWGIWIDYNMDGDFESSEKIFSGNGTGGTVTGNTSSLVAATNVRLRVSLMYNAAPVACSNNNYGEVEDYTVTIKDDEPCVDPITAPSNLATTGKTTTTVSLSWTASTGGASNCPALSNYNVYRDGSIVGSPTNTNFTDTDLTAATTYTYTVKAEDADGGETNASNSVTVSTNTPVTYSLTVNVSGQGSVTPNGGTFNEGESVSLTATPDAGWQFESWSGNLTGSSNPANITMNSNKTVTATFSDIPNEAPTVNITSPSDGANYNVGDNITINANADDNDGNVTLVEFYQGSTKLGEDATSPYSISWNNVALGSYQLLAVATDDEGATATSDPIDISVTDDPPPYCDAQSTSSAYEYFSKVQFGSIDQTSGSNGYDDHTAVSTNLTIGVAQQLSMTTVGNYSSDEIVVYIDYNRDGDFADSGEEVYFTNNAGTAKTYIATITAPSDASTGSTRMRIVLYDVTYNAKSSCDDFNYGEVEDYTIILSGAQGPLAENKAAETLKTYPNPVIDGNLTVETSNLEDNINIYGPTGKLVKSINVNSDLVKVDLAGFPSGMYLVQQGDLVNQIIIE